MYIKVDGMLAGGILYLLAVLGHDSQHQHQVSRIHPIDRSYHFLGCMSPIAPLRTPTRCTRGDLRRWCTWEEHLYRLRQGYQESLDDVHLRWRQRPALGRVGDMLVRCGILGRKRGMTFVYPTCGFSCVKDSVL